MINYMRKLILLFSCMLMGVVSVHAQNKKADTGTNKDTLFVPYHVKNMTILLGKSERDRNRPDVKRWYQYWAKEHAQASMKGKPCPDFVLVDSVGQLHRISDYIGKHKLLFLDFWASWCKPCRASFPWLREFYEEYQNKGVEIIGVSIDKNKTSWEKALSDEKLPWLQVLDGTLGHKEKRVGELYDVLYVPTFVLLDKEGKIVVRAHMEKEDLIKQVEEILAK